MRPQNKYHRLLLGKQRILRAYRNTKGKGFHGYYICDWKKTGPKYRHFTYANAWAKNFSNRILRRLPVDIDIPDGGAYRKFWEYKYFCW